MTPSLRRLRVTFAAVLLTLLVPAITHASGSTVIRDCTDDGRLSKSYSQKDYRDALNNIPTDVDEYTDCRDVIRHAQLAGAATRGGGGSGGGGRGTTGTGATGGASTASPGSGGGAAAPATAAEALDGASAAEVSAVQKATSTLSGAPLQVGDTQIAPAELSQTDLSSLSSIPTPLMLVLALLVLAAAGGAVSAVLSRVRSRRVTTGA